MSASNQEQAAPSNLRAAETALIFRAPNGLEIAHHSLSETRYVYREVFEDRVYFQHGIDLAPGETVFDIGANIGLFTMFVKESFPDTNVHAFEPSPVILSVLAKNVGRYGDSVRVHACGMAEREGKATFTFYPNYSIMSGFHAGSGQDGSTLRSGIKSYLLEKGTDPAEITDPLLDRLVRVALKQTQEYVCRLRSVSEVMDEAGVAGIGLLKIDAEGSEMAILAGIREEHWKGIRQIVMEIHDPTGAARAEAKRILEGRGYGCVFEEEKQLSESGIVNCYARRAQPAASAEPLSRSSNSKS